MRIRVTWQVSRASYYCLETVCIVFFNLDDVLTDSYPEKWAKRFWPQHNDDGARK